MNADCKSVSHPSQPHNRALLVLALPLLGGQLAQAGFGFVDTVMAGQAGTAALAGVAVGASIWLPLYLFMLGVLMNATPVMARLLSQGQAQAADRTLQQALLLAAGLALLLMLLLIACEPLLPWLNVDARLIPTVRGYLIGISVGVPAAAIFLVLRCYTEALKHTRPIFWISLAGLLINIPCNYVLIHGKFGFPALGGAGCGWATSISAWFMVGLMWLYLRRHPHYRSHPLRLLPLHVEGERLLRLLKLGLPSGLSMFFEVSIFAAIALLISSLGPVVTAGHQVALNVSSLTFMVPLSLALATTIRVGHARGQADAVALDAIIRHAFRVSTIIGLLLAGLLLAGHQLLPPIYTDDSRVTLLASQLLLLAAAYQLSDAWQVMAIGCLRGFEDTTWSMVITVVVYWGLSLPLGYALGMTDLLLPAMGPAGFWIGIIVGLSFAALLLQWRLRVLMRRSHLLFATAHPTA